MKREICKEKSQNMVYIYHVYFLNRGVFTVEEQARLFSPKNICTSGIGCCLVVAVRTTSIDIDLKLAKCNL